MGFVLLEMSQDLALESNLGGGERALRGIALISETLKLKQILALFGSTWILRYSLLYMHKINYLSTHF